MYIKKVVLLIVPNAFKSIYTARGILVRDLRDDECAVFAL